MNFEIIRIDKNNFTLLNQTASDVFDYAIDFTKLESLTQDPNHIMLVALTKQTVVGQTLAMVHKHPDKPTELYIDDLAVTTTLHRHGIAKRLLTAVMQIGIQFGCESAWVAAASDNQAAKSLYKSLGLSSERCFIFEKSLRP